MIKLKLLQLLGEDNSIIAYIIELFIGYPNYYVRIFAFNLLVNNV